MKTAGTTRQDMPWLEPLASLVFFSFALFINQVNEWPWTWVVDLVGCTGAAMSRRWPVAGALITGFGMGAWLLLPEARSSVSAMAFYINVFAAVRISLPWRIPLTVAFSGLAYVTLVREIVSNPVDQWVTSSVLLVILAAVWSAGLLVRHSRRGILDERESSEQRLQDLQRSLARELHDSVAQTLSSAAMRANIARLEPGLSPFATDQMERIADECRSSAHDLRQLLSVLREQRDPILTSGPPTDIDTLRRTIDGQVERLRAEGFSATATVHLSKLSAARCGILSALTVEAVNNIVKHAKPGSQCTISITSDENDVLGEFISTMQSPKVSPPGLGLMGIQERLSLLDGTSFVAIQDTEWKLQVRLPLGTNHGAVAGSDRGPSQQRKQRGLPGIITG